MTMSPSSTPILALSPLSSVRPGPTAMTVPSCGRSFAVSGSTMPPAVWSLLVFGCTSTLSPNGLIFAIVANPPSCSSLDCCLFYFSTLWMRVLIQWSIIGLLRGSVKGLSQKIGVKFAVFWAVVPRRTTMRIQWISGLLLAAALVSGCSRGEQQQAEDTTERALKDAGKTATKALENAGNAAAKAVGVTGDRASHGRGRGDG